LLRAFAMPVLTLTCVIVAQMMRMTRAAVIDQLRRLCRDGAAEGGLAAAHRAAHALPNAVGPIANAVALSLSYLLGGVIIVEIDLQLSRHRQADGRRRGARATCRWCRPAR
jgi:peptide/nickel transport system permease protein